MGGAPLAPAPPTGTAVVVRRCTYGSVVGAMGDALGGGARGVLHAYHCRCRFS